MEKIKNFFDSKNKDILIWGYGVSGKSFLEFCQHYLDKTNRYIIIDKKFSEMEMHGNVTYVNEAFFVHYIDLVEFILPSPGIVLDRNAFYYNKIIFEFDIFFYLNQKMNYETILVTGSIGKTSTVTMLAFYFKKYYDLVFTAGNIGIPLLLSLNFDDKKKMIIIEASSAQLEHTLLVNPDYLIITNLYENHFDFHQSFYDYGVAKLKPLLVGNVIKKCIFHRTVIDFISSNNIIFNKDNKNKIISFQNNIINYNPFQTCDNHTEVAYLSDFPNFSYPENWILISIMQRLILGVSIDYTKEEVPVLPHFRLEKIYEKKNIIIYNDSKSTVMESTESAVKILLNRHQNSLLYCIIGGLSKGVVRKEKFNKLLTLVDKMFVFGKEKDDFVGCNIIYKDFLADVVKVICDDIKRNNIFHNDMNNKQIVILFSPGGSSFDLYSSYIDRGNSFNELINLYFD